MISKNITISFLPTPLAQELLSLEWPTENLALRTMLTGGDKLLQYPSDLVPFQVVNNYGPTENTVVTTSGLVVTKEQDRISPTIGRAIANTQVYILDSNLELVPVGVPGELHIAGVGLARGYLNRPELTTEKFIPNPFEKAEGKKLYKTGDLVRYLPDGNIEYIGRIDNQVKIRGFRIELAEIETLLGQHGGVQICCVITSLVAVHLACQSLLNCECDIALAGGVSISLPQKMGYLYQEEMILSPDGHCRTFDAKAQGTIGGSGAGIVILKRLEDAISDRDHIHAIIKGSATNNDGAMKVGYTAPSVSGQAAVISEAQTLAGVDAQTISYIEAHGTATPLGDPIEIAALTQAFRQTTDEKGFCAIGSVKTNFGHLDTAAGVAGLIKTVLALEHKMLPPSLHFETPNPKIDFANSPFYVNTTLTEWKTDNIPRRAGVSSFGIGGTNAHVILEEAPTQLKIQNSKLKSKYLVLCLSAKTASALEKATANLITYLKEHPEVSLGDVAYTLNSGRRRFNHRRMLVCRDLEGVYKINLKQLSKDDDELIDVTLNAS